MTMQLKKFKKLHHSEQPLLIGNVWDVQSALIYQNPGYQAIGTSSAAIAHSFGYEDGENIPFQDYLFMIKRILESTTIPLTVDLESGYGNEVKTIFENINKLYELGVVGINLEDSLVVDGIRSIADATVFSLKLEQLVQMLKENDVEVFINVRCDTFLLGLPNPLAETIARIKLYERTAIDGIFLPCLTDEKDITTVIEITSVPGYGGGLWWRKQYLLELEQLNR